MRRRYGERREAHSGEASVGGRASWRGELLRVWLFQAQEGEANSKIYEKFTKHCEREKSYLSTIKEVLQWFFSNNCCKKFFTAIIY